LARDNVLKTKNMEQNKQIELRSDKVRDVIGQVPPKLLRYGISIIGLSLLMLVIISAFIPYQPSFNTKITVTKNENGKLSYIADISPEAMRGQSRIAYILLDSASELPLPDKFRISQIADTVRLSTLGMWYVASLQPIDTVYQTVRLEDELVFPGKIRLERRSLLVWSVRRVLDR
jgi:hypothetical protein